MTTCNKNHTQCVAVQRAAPQFTAKAVVNGAIQPSLSLSDYKDRIEEFRQLGAEVLALSVDSVYSHLAWVNTPRKAGGLGAMNIPLVADLTKDIAKDYGVLIEEEGIALRGLFIIDAKGVVRQITVNDLPVGRNVDETLRLIQALQYADMHGDVVPCDWKPGKATIRPAEAKTYFEQTNKE